MVIPSSLFLLSFVFFPTLFSLILLFHLLGAHIPGKVPRKILPMYHVPAPLFCVGRPSIFEARAICLVQKKNTKQTKKTHNFLFSNSYKKMLPSSSDTGLTTAMPVFVHLRTQFSFSVVSRFMLLRDLKKQCWHKLALTNQSVRSALPLDTSYKAIMERARVRYSTNTLSQHCS